MHDIGRRALPALALLILPQPGQTETAQIADIGLESGFQDTWFGHLKRGRACVAADFDLDGRIDFYVGNPGDESFVIRNVTAPGGDIGFELVQTLLDGPIAWAAASADYDNDGDHDLFVACGANEGIGFDYLFRNMWIEDGDGSLRFVDVTGTAGVSGPVPPGGSSPIQVASAGAVWGDVDRDGYADLFVSVNVHLNSLPQIKGRNILWRNRGDGTFQDITGVSGLGATQLPTRNATFLDIDNDGDLDLYESTQLAPNVLWRNLLVETGTVSFEDVTALFSAPGDDLAYPYQTFASASADLDQDGWEDIVAFMRYQAPEPPASPYGPGHAVFLNQGGTGFTNVASTLGVNAQLPLVNGVMGCQIGDLNADGVPDLFFGNGGPSGGTKDELFVSSSAVGQPLSYGNWSDSLDWAAAEDAAIVYPSYPYRTHGTCFVDLDGDGILEMAIVNGGPSGEPDPEPNRLFTFEWNPARRFFKIRPVGNGTTVNRGAIGTRAVLTVRTGGGPSRALHQTLFGGQAFAAQNGHELYFGLADADTIESLEIRWPDGVVDTVTSGLEINSSVAILREGSLPGQLCFPSEGPESSCSDGVDNDCDGFTDGADLDCLLSTAALPSSGPAMTPDGRSAPNPFRGSTALRFSLPEAGPVRARVYDVSGGLVRSLLSATLEAGDHEILWDARDDAGAPVPGGVYFYRISSGGRHRTGKMVLTR